MLGNVKGNLVDNIDNNIDFLLYEVGINIKVNHVNKRAIIIDNKEKPTDYDTKVIITNFLLNQSDLIHYDNIDWLIVGEIDTSKNTYRAKMQKCNFTIKFPIGGTYPYDYEVPVIPSRASFNISNGTYVNIPDGEVYVTFKQDAIINPRGLTTDYIGLNYKFIKWGQTFEVAGIDKTKKGLITFHATKVTNSGNDTQMANESFYYDKNYSISITNSINTLEFGNTYKPTVFVVGTTGEVPIYYTAVTDDTISVSSDGTVTPLKAGKATLEVFSQGVYKDIEFTVKEPVYSINITNKVENIGINYNYTLNIDCYKDNIKDTTPTITYISNNTNIATIDSTGKITGIKQGSVTITATYQNISDIMNVNIIPINTIAITNKVNQLKIGQNYTPIITCTSNNVVDTNPTVTYTISDPNILSINNGIVSIIGAGTATIVIAYKDVIDSVTIVCSNITYAISITNKPSSELNNGSTYQLNISCTQDETVDTTPVITYTSSNTAIATINSTGLVTCIGIGSTTITVNYHGISDSVDVTVVSAHQYVLSVSPTTISINNNSTASITASVTDKGTVVSNASFTYSSDNTAVATVSSSGLVTGISVGSANITVSYIGQDGNTYIKTVPTVINAPVAKTVKFYNGSTEITTQPYKLLNGDTVTITTYAYAGDTQTNDTFTFAMTLQQGGDSSYYSLNIIDGNNFSVNNIYGDGGEYITITATGIDGVTTGTIKIRLAGEW